MLHLVYFRTNIKDVLSTMDLRCSVILKGHYKVKPENNIYESVPILKQQNIKGNGNVKIKLGNFLSLYFFKIVIRH